MDSSCFALFKCVLSLQALCTTSHLRVHTYLHTVMTFIQGATYPSLATRGSVTAFTCTAQSDNSILLLRMGWRAVSSQSLHAGEIIRLSATACLPLASRLTFQDTADVQHGRREARIVMLFHAAWCWPTQLCLSQVKAMWADIDHRAPFTNSYWRSLHTLQEESEYDRKLWVSFSDLAKSNFAEDYGLYMHFKTQIIIRVRQDSY